MKPLPHIFRYLCLCLLSCCVALSATAQTWNPAHAIGTSSGNNNFSYNQTPDQLVELRAAAFPNTGLSYQWWSSNMPTTGFTAISGATSSSYTISGNTAQTMYYYRVTANPSDGSSIVSNTVKIALVSVNWEDYNYVREHDVETSGITDWKTVDGLAIGKKMQTTSYMDGLGRSIQKVSAGTATPAASGGTWGDMVQFSQYDSYGRQPVKYLPYTTTNDLGKYKTSTATDQPQYYTSTYSETSAFFSISFDNSPLNRVDNVKKSGAAWAAAPGNSAVYDVNTLTDNVQIFSVDYVQGDAPVDLGAYPANTLYRITYTDENGKQVVEFTDKSGRMILKKVQSDDIPTAAHAGWICTYNVYDDYGLLRYQLQPEAVKYLDGHNWSFTGTDGPQVLAGLCFQYNYDDKRRITWKKAPGTAPLNMLYDARDRVVFMQDGNQAAIPQWTANLYDMLDRPVITTLYNTSENIPGLQADINNATTVTTSITAASTTGNADKTYDTRDPNVATYTASNSITFLPGFIMQPGDNGFQAYIDPSAGTPVTTTSNVVYTSPISATGMGDASVTTILKYFFYDDYTFAGAKPFYTGFNNTSAYNSSDATYGSDVLPVATDPRTTGMATGTMVRVLGTATFLKTTNYFDEKGRHIQSSEDNIKSGTDIVTMQYHWDGRVLSSSSSHTTSGTGYTNFTILTKYIFDKLGRVISQQKQFGNNPFKTTGSYDYDDVGRVKNKHLDPSYNNPSTGQTGDLESLAYSFNIHNQLTGINKDYALKNPASYDKWGHFFGMYLGFDNRDGAFSTTQLNGQVGGQLWCTQGDDAQRKYEYTYDNAGRLVNADFNQQQHPGDGWAKTPPPGSTGASGMDFSVKGIIYDLNGNLQAMQQMGVQAGNNTPVMVDDLHYRYASYSNQLLAVTDQMTATTVNGKFGDFKDGANGSSDDYVYDANGNLVIDLNKNVQQLDNTTANGIHYNVLDKPDQIRIVGKGTVKIVYSADGDRLQRAYIPESGTAGTVTTYINSFVYQETTALTTSSTAPYGGSAAPVYFGFGEGRIRILQPTNIQSTGGYDGLSIDGNMDLPGGMRGAYDYFITDHQGNTRMVLTEETHSAYNTCTMENTPARTAVEDPVFGQTGSGNEVEATRVATSTATGWNNNLLGSSVSRLGNWAGHNIGPNNLQKVMAGDVVGATVQYYYQAPTSTNNTNSIVSTLLGSLVSAISNGSAASGLARGEGAGIQSQLTNNSGFGGFVQPTTASTDQNSPPQAYLTILFFDERFNFVSAADGGAWQQQVGTAGTVADGSSLTGTMKAPKNGYTYVYVSNASDQNVFFDNLKVGIVAGNIIEENHYYAYGLKIAAISSKKLGDAQEGNLKNNYLYQGDYNEFDDDIGWNDFALREYDPQIGRFTTPDPMDEFASPYVGMGNDPVNNTDPSGGSVFESVGADLLVGAVGGAIIGGITGAITGNHNDANSFFKGAAIGASLGVASFASIDFLNGATQHVVQGVGRVPWRVAMQALNLTIHLAEQPKNTPRFASTNPGADGMEDAIKNALLLGAPDIYNVFMGNDPLSEYSTQADRETYITSRTATDALIASISINVSNGANAAAGAAQIAAIAGSETVVVGAGAEIVAGIAKVLALYGKSVAAAATGDVAISISFMAKYEVHHNDPKQYGGEDKQPFQTKMTVEQHRALHKAMRKFMRQISKLLLPAPGRNGASIVTKWGRDYLLEKLAEFYRQPIIQEFFKEAADNFFKLHPKL